MKLLNRLASAGLALIAASAGVAALESPAMANSSTICYTNSFWDVTKKCQTGSMHPNAAHDLRVEVFACKGAPWWVWDTGTGHSVAHGTGKGQSVEVNVVIRGLYGVYKAKLTDSCYGDAITLEDY